MITSLDCYKKWGDPFETSDEGKYMTLWNVPEYVWKYIPEIPRRIYCNKQMALPLELAFLAIINRGLANEIRTWDGCFQVRPIRGYEKLFWKLYNRGNIEAAMKYVSTHAWGVAVDINAAWNGLGVKGEMSDELGQCFVDASFTWGKHFKRFDYMHFQLEYLV